MLRVANTLPNTIDNVYLSTRQIVTFSDAVYEFCAADCYNTLVQRIVTYLPRLVAMDSCVFFPIDEDRYRFISAVFNGIDPATFAPYQTVYEPYDEYKRIVFSMTPRPTVNRSSDYMDYVEWAKNPHRAEFLLPNGLYHLAGLQIFAGHQVIGTCGMYRDVGAEFSDDDMRVLHALQRHIDLAFTTCRYAPPPPEVIQAAEHWRLSARELEIANLITQGIGNDCLAAQLQISVNTVKTHIKHLLEKSGCQNRSELAYRMSCAASK